MSKSLILVALVLATASCAILQPASDPPDSRATSPEQTPDPPTREEKAPREDVPETTEPEAIEPAETAWAILASGTQSAVRVPITRAVSDPSVWRDIWYAITANQADPPEVPEVDFQRESAIILILGERPTGGYSVGIADIVERRESVEVVVEVSRPAPGEMVTQALTTPYSIAVVRITGKEFVFVGDSLEAGFEGD